jgi:hypothetical protein
MDASDLLRHNGADLVFTPFHDAAERAVIRMREVSG